jgi:hypothetical protein
MKIRILEVHKKSAHYGRDYDLTGAVGKLVEKDDKPDGSFYVELTDVVYPKGFIYPDAVSQLCLFVQRYEVVTDGE